VPYPYRLQTSLRAKYPSRMIDVLNRGIGGQEAPDELARMRDDVNRGITVIDHLAGRHQRRLATGPQPRRRCRRDRETA